MSRILVYAGESVLYPAHRFLSIWPPPPTPDMGEAALLPSCRDFFPLTGSSIPYSELRHDHSFRGFDGVNECIAQMLTWVAARMCIFWKHGQIGPTMVVRDETGAGHESAGEIVEIGENVRNWQVGDRVAIEAGVPCGQADCDPCRTGRYNACE